MTIWSVKAASWEGAGARASATGQGHDGRRAARQPTYLAHSRVRAVQAGRHVPHGLERCALGQLENAQEPRGRVAGAAGKDGAGAGFSDGVGGRARAAGPAMAAVGTPQAKQEARGEKTYRGVMGVCRVMSASSTRCTSTSADSSSSVSTKFSRLDASGMGVQVSAAESHYT